jgi:predicted DsbA family dithiol-disulfide isomerase
MTNDGKLASVTFYHSVICPRCHFSTVMLNRVLKEFPGIHIERKELFSHIKEATAAGAKSIPALVAGDKVLRGVVFTPGMLREFFRGIQSTAAVE